MIYFYLAFLSIRFSQFCALICPVYVQYFGFVAFCCLSVPFLCNFFVLLILALLCFALANSSDAFVRYNFSEKDLLQLFACELKPFCSDCLLN